MDFDFNLDLMHDEAGIIGAQAEIRCEDSEDEDDSSDCSGGEAYEDALEHHSVELQVTPEAVNPPSAKISSNDFKKLSVLGLGGYGVVYLSQKVTGRDAGALFAIKCLSKAKIVRSVKDTAHTKAERSVLEIVNNPFIVNLKYAYQDDLSLFLVLEFCQGGELFTRLSKKNCLSEDLATFYAAEISLAIGHLHSMDVVYRDLKPENVMLTHDGHVKVADFGLCKQAIGKSEKTHTFCGTVDYMAPEIVLRRGHDKSVDWWSLGTLIYDMLTGQPPFTSNNRSATIDKIKACRVIYPQYITNECKSLLRGLIKRDPQKRLGHGDEDVAAVKRHPFFRHIDWDKLYRKEIPPPDSDPPVFEDPYDLQLFDPRFTNMTLEQAAKVNTVAKAEVPVPPNTSSDDWHFQGFTYTDSEFFSGRSRSPRKASCGSHEGYSAPKQQYPGTATSPAVVPFSTDGPPMTVSGPSNNVTIGFNVPGGKFGAGSAAGAGVRGAASAASAAGAASSSSSHARQLSREAAMPPSYPMNGYRSPLDSTYSAAAAVATAAAVHGCATSPITTTTQPLDSLGLFPSAHSHMTNGFASSSSGGGGGASSNGYTASGHHAGYSSSNGCASGGISNSSGGGQGFSTSPYTSAVSSGVAALAVSNGTGFTPSSAGSAVGGNSSDLLTAAAMTTDPICILAAKDPVTSPVH
eukprot:scpid36493/ scgid14228/ Ribosomal protein S6 kinase beta-1; 70 kDa ribosomal protein S6 kinase 1; Ribosomal protein S6 kinase I; p70 ribosomal S6 kinase alpha